MCQRAVRKAHHVVASRSYSIVHDVPRTTGSLPHNAPPSPAPRSVFNDAVNATRARNSWTKDEITEIYKTPLMDLAYAAVSTAICRLEHVTNLENRALYTDASTSQEPCSYVHS